MFAVKLSVCFKSSPIFPDFCHKYSHISGRSNRVFSIKSCVEDDRSRLQNPVSKRPECVSLVLLTAINSDYQDLSPTPAIAELVDRNVQLIDRRAGLLVGRAGLLVGRAAIPVGRAALILSPVLQESDNVFHRHHTNTTTPLSPQNNCPFHNQFPNQFLASKLDVLAVIHTSHRLTYLLPNGVYGGGGKNKRCN